MNDNRYFDIEKQIKEDNRKDPAIIYSYEDKFARRGIVTDNNITTNMLTILSFILDLIVN